MDFFVLHPEVAGGLGAGSELDTSVHPPHVTRLDYEFADWFGDALLESFPVFVIKRAVGEELLAAGYTGAELASVQISVTVEAQERMTISGITQLPEFRWFKVFGKAGADDFGLLPDATLVVSDRALAMLRAAGIQHCEVEPY